MTFAYFKSRLCTVVIVAVCTVSIHCKTATSGENSDSDEAFSTGQEEVNKQTIADYIIVTRSVNSKSKSTPASIVVSKNKYTTVTHKPIQWFNPPGIKTNTKLPTVNGTATETKRNNTYASLPKQNSIYKMTYESSAASKIRIKKSTPSSTSKPQSIFPIILNTPQFGGLTDTALGLSLASRMSYVNNLPAYSVQHYWHTGLHPVRRNIEIQNTVITGCPKNVSFCLSDTMTMCLSNGEIYCVVPQHETELCKNATMGECLKTILAISCEKSWAPECLQYGRKWKYEEASLPCISHIRVNYAENYTTYDKRFMIPEGINKTCSCNDTKVTVKCITLENTRIICSGVNLSNNTLVSMNTNLSSKNAKYVSCLFTQSNNNEVLPDILAAQRMSLLSRCELINSNSSTTIEMMCGHIGNLPKVLESVDVNGITMNCEVSSTQIRSDTIKSSVCDCNSTSSFNQTRIPFITTRFCAYVAAFSAKSCTNMEYLKIMNTYPEEKKQASATTNTIMSAILNYVFAK